MSERSLPYFVHESSYVDEGASIGPGTKIWHFSHIMPNATIGSDCRIGQNVNVGSRARIGDNVKIQNNVSVYDEVVLEDDVFCGPSMVFTNVVNPRSHITRKDEYKPTLVRRGATLGANCTIVCGVTIGRFAFVGAGAVVTRDVADYALMLGTPARQTGWMCQCGVRLDLATDAAVPDVTCQACGDRYQMIDGVLHPASPAPVTTSRSSS
jgi:UDP-2-acetamido-3-amino-2,3-dideoxy-glucuronate N-acetyltransferase